MMMTFEPRTTIVSGSAYSQSSGYRGSERRHPIGTEYSTVWPFGTTSNAWQIHIEKLNRDAKQYAQASARMAKMVKLMRRRCTGVAELVIVPFGLDIVGMC
jgi:hypothetical protein